MIPLKYSTASQEIVLGYFLDETDGKTAEDGLTIGNTDIKLWKSGATTLADKNSGGATHISGGIYYAVLDATDTGTYGPMKIFVHVSGALPCILECLVMEANAYDALMAASGTGYVDVESDALGSTQLADSVPADGTIPTKDQALYMITQFLLERSVSSTTVTVKKADGSTSLMTLTLDSATSPTSITRAT